MPRTWASGSSASARIAAGSSRNSTSGFNLPNRRRGPMTRPGIRCSMDRTQIIGQALGLAQAVAAFVARARRFFYEEVLSERVCLQCGGPLVMVAEGRRRCQARGDDCDPTVAFQRCSRCGGQRPRQIGNNFLVGCHTRRRWMVFTPCPRRRSRTGWRQSFRSTRSEDRLAIARSKPRSSTTARWTALRLTGPGTPR